MLNVFKKMADDNNVIRLLLLVHMCASDGRKLTAEITFI